MNNDRFVSGMLAGVALGALVVLAMSPQARGPMMNGASQLGNRMRNMWGKRDEMMDQVQQMMPDMS